MHKQDVILNNEENTNVFNAHKPKHKQFSQDFKKQVVGVYRGGYMQILKNVEYSLSTRMRIRLRASPCYVVILA